jgi:hypothetical protein
MIIQKIKRLLTYFLELVVMVCLSAKDKIGNEKEIF